MSGVDSGVGPFDRSAVDAAGRGLHHPADAVTLRCVEHGEGAVGVDAVRGEGVIDRPGDRTERPLVEHHLNAGDRLVEGLDVGGMR